MRHRMIHPLKPEINREIIDAYFGYVLTTAHFLPSWVKSTFTVTLVDFAFQIKTSLGWLPFLV